MRTVLSNLISNSAINDEDFLLLSGDHGYALFDEIRSNKPDQFVNVGIMEQALISMSAGLSKVGFKPMCYGLASFVPIRVLEQIKFDVCLPKLPIKMIGDGAGLIYTHLGNSHLCAEDIASLMPLPHVEIYAPGDKEEMRICYKEFYDSNLPAYLRVGKCDNPNVNKEELSSTEPYFTHKSDSKTCFISSGAMLGTVNRFASEKNVSHISVMKLKPLSTKILDMIKDFDHIIFFEEHTRKGGVVSAVTDLCIDHSQQLPKIDFFCLNSSFIHKAGTYQYALSEHGISINQMEEKLEQIL
jgi:transketolase